MKPAAAEIIVTGVVHGVGYRYFCLKQAVSLNIFGWVKNNPNGSVISLAEGDKSSIEAFIKELRIGPSSASVVDVSVIWNEFTGQYSKYEIRF